MAAVTPTLPNKDSARSTALKLYTGEVLKAFREKNVALPTVKVRNISGGKTAQFIVTGRADEANIQTHVPGEEVINQILPNDEVTITVDTRYVYSHFLDELDEKIAQYEVRGELAYQAGEVLATKIDKDVFYGIIHDGGTFTPKPGQSAAATVVADGYTAATTAEDKGNALIEAFYEAKAVLNGRNVTETPTVFVAPQDYYNIVQSTRGVNADWTSNNGGIDVGQIRQIAGFSIGWTNHLDKTDQTGNGGIDAQKLVALMYTKGTFGVVKAMDLQSEANYDFRRLGWQLTSFYAMGMGMLDATALIFIMAD